MADLMTQKVTYKELADKYANFIVPVAKINVNGLNVIKTQNLVVQELEVKLSLYTASSVTIKFSDQYEEEEHSFKSAVKNTFLPGTIVEVELGYLSTTQKVFKGYVEMTGVEMGEAEYFVVTLMDVKRLMMISGKKELLYSVTNYSDAFKQVMNSYSAVCSVDVDATSDKLENPIAQMGTDYEFVTQELIGKGKTNREFVVLAGTAYFRKPGKVTTPIMKARYGRELTNLQISHCYRELDIEVIGMDDSEKIVTGKASVVGNVSQKKLLVQKPVYTVTDASADTKEKADTKAEVIARNLQEKSTIGRGATIGLPEIVPGRYLEVENIDSMIDKKYYITEVTHFFTNENFVTQFEVGGCV